MKRLLIMLIIPLVLTGCDFFQSLFKKAEIAFVDVADAAALAIKSGDTRIDTVDQDNELYKQLVDGSWEAVRYYDKRGRETEAPDGMLYLMRLDDRFFVAVYGNIHSDDEMNMTWEYWDDVFLMDVDNGTMYYLNQFGNAFTEGLPPMTDWEPSMITGIDSSGSIYYLAGPSSYNSFTEKTEQLRNYSAVTKLSVGTDADLLTGEFLTPDTRDVNAFCVDSSGNLVYEVELVTGGRVPVYRMSNGTADFLDLGASDLFVHHYVSGGDGNAYVVAGAGAMDAHLYRIDFSAPSPSLVQVAGPFSDWELHSVQEKGDHILIIGQSVVLKYQYTGGASTVSISDSVPIRSIINKSGDLVYILTNNHTPLVYLVDLASESYIGYPLDGSRYTVQTFRDYALVDGAVYAELTDIITGTTGGYILYPDGQISQLTETTVESQIIVIEPL